MIFNICQLLNSNVYINKGFTFVNMCYILLSMETELTKLEKQVLTEAREYCKKHGLVLYKYLSKGIKKQLEGDLKNDN